MICQGHRVVEASDYIILYYIIQRKTNDNILMNRFTTTVFRKSAHRRQAHVVGGLHGGRDRSARWPIR